MVVKPDSPWFMWQNEDLGNACGSIALLHSVANCDLSYKKNSIIDKFLKSIQNRAELTKDAILHGNPRDLESYRELVGELKGLEYAEQEIKDYLEKQELE